MPHLSASGDGYIVNVRSLASRNSFASGTCYNASKFGLLGMSEATMLDVRYSDVRVSIVMPGSVNTPVNDHETSAERSWKLEADDCALACDATSGLSTRGPCEPHRDATCAAE